MLKYILCKYIPQNKVWTVYQTFESREDLVKFLAYGTNVGYNNKRVHWTNIYIDNQNLTGKDITTNYRTVAKRDEDGNIIYDKNGFVVYESYVERTLREWCLQDVQNRTIDMRLFKEEVFDIVEQMSDDKRHYLTLRRMHLYRRSHSRRQGRPRHKTTHYRYSQNNHRYTRTLNAPGVPEEVNDILTSQQIERLKTKPKDNYARFMWGDDFWTRGPTGWKEHKNRKQWEARVKRNTDDVSWVGNKDKKTIAFELNKSEPAEFSAGSCFFFRLSNSNNCSRSFYHNIHIFIYRYHIIYTEKFFGTCRNLI